MEAFFDMLKTVGAVVMMISPAFYADELTGWPELWKFILTGVAIYLGLCVALDLVEYLIREHRKTIRRREINSRSERARRQLQMKKAREQRRSMYCSRERRTG